METSYRKLLSIGTWHEHFGGAACPDLAVAPMAATAQLMRNFQMRLRPETGGAALYISARNLTADGLPKVPLVFQLTVQDPRVYQYTALAPPEGPDARVALYDNLRVFQDRSQKDALLLAKPGPVAQVPVQGEKPEDTVALDRPAAGVFGVVTIHLGQAKEPKVPPKMRALAEADGKPQEPRFMVPLQARQAKFCYLVAGVDEGAKIEASVVATKAAITFDAPEVRHIAGRQAWVFQSEAAYPVLADPRGVYSAKLITSDGNERLLPLPSVASLKAVAGGQDMVAEMVVLAERVV